MKRCLACQAVHPTAAPVCPRCGIAPVLVDGFPAYAPALTHDGGGFKPGYFAKLERLEEANFWFQSRNALILWALAEYGAGFRSFLEIGCGTGFVLSGISKAFPDAELHASEIFTAGLAVAACRVSGAKFMQMDARNIPFKEEFDVVGAFDVLEHILEDEAVLAQAHGSLAHSGLLVLTVPQHAWLWSPADEYACHVRRYAAKELHQKVEAAGFHILRSTSFVSTLLPAMAMSRLLQKFRARGPFDAEAELRISPWMNTLFLRMLGAELAAIRKGFDFPVGGSRLVVARKRTPVEANGDQP